MMPPAKPQLASDYPSMQTELAERVLLDVWNRLGAFHEFLVLVGGLVPRFLVQGARSPYHAVPLHCGTMDVDLGIRLAVADVEAYATVRETLENHGFQPGRNQEGGEQRHSFFKTVQGIDIIVDFLTTRYSGPECRVTRPVDAQLSAIQVEGLGLALDNPVRVDLEGESLEDGLTRATVRVCGAAPFIVLKALALKKRNERKDAYDLVYMLRYYKDGPASVAAEIPSSMKGKESFRNALTALRDKFGSPAHDGPGMYANFIGNTPADAQIQAFAAVQEFLEAAGNVGD